MLWNEWFILLETMRDVPSHWVWSSVLVSHNPFLSWYLDNVGQFFMSTVRNHLLLMSVGVWSTHHTHQTSRFGPYIFWSYLLQGPKASHKPEKIYIFVSSWILCLGKDFGNLCFKISSCFIAFPVIFHSYDLQFFIFFLPTLLSIFLDFLWNM